jgi:ATP-dependent Lon protease
MNQPSSNTSTTRGDRLVEVDVQDVQDEIRRSQASSNPDVEEQSPQVLPTLIVPQTLLLPHMSLPYPIDDGEESRVIEHAMAGDRLVLVLGLRDQVDDDDEDFDEETAETKCRIQQLRHHRYR